MTTQDCIEIHTSEGTHGLVCCCTGTTQATQSIDEIFLLSRKTSIHAAVLDHDTTRLHALLSRHKERADEVDGAGYAPVLYARSLDLIDVFLEFGADVKGARTRDGGRTVLHRAVVWRDAEFVWGLLKRGLVDDVRDSDGMLARDLAERYGCLDIHRILTTHSTAAAK